MTWFPKPADIFINEFFTLISALRFNVRRNVKCCYLISVCFNLVETTASKSTTGLVSKNLAAVLKHCNFNVN